jgi:hypothetical protein
MYVVDQSELGSRQKYYDVLELAGSVRKRPQSLWHGSQFTDQKLLIMVESIM